MVQEATAPPARMRQHGLQGPGKPLKCSPTEEHKTTVLPASLHSTPTALTRRSMAWSPDEKIGWPMQKGSQRRRVNIVAGEMQSWWCEDHEKRPGRWSGFQKSA